mmetsp:Transcript_24776/g.71503  ORF Transcript_24776/g.71503 Transcript_24776/m.71503 type:complete len:232 (-) Transcript_24776:160-855(-)
MDDAKGCRVCSSRAGVTLSAKRSRCSTSIAWEKVNSDSLVWSCCAMASMRASVVLVGAQWSGRPLRYCTVAPAPASSRTRSLSVALLCCRAALSNRCTASLTVLPTFHPRHADEAAVVLRLQLEQQVVVHQGEARDGKEVFGLASPLVEQAEDDVRRPVGVHTRPILADLNNTLLPLAQQRRVIGAVVVEQLHVVSEPLAAVIGEETLKGNSSSRRSSTNTANDGTSLVRL